MVGWRPFANRNSEPEQRIHDTLTEDARGRIAYAMTSCSTRGEIQTAYTKYRINRGRHIDYFDTKNSGPALESLHQFITTEEDDEVLTILELLINQLWDKSDLASENHSTETLVDLDDNLRQILLEEGILLKLKPDRETVYEFAEALDKHQNGGRSYRSRRSYDPRPTRDWQLEFEWQAHGAVIESDQAVRRLGRQERWEGVLAPYDEAWEEYQSLPVSYVVAEKLYNSLENTLEKICVEEQGWTSEGDGVSAHIEALKDNGILDPNPTMVYEWNQLTEGLKAGLQKMGGDRKRHENFDEDYALLLLHQVGAFLSFVISRYESQYAE